MSHFQCCPACQSTNQERLCYLGRHPKSLISLQTDPVESAASARHPITLVICRNCAHVHNADFNPSVVAYSDAGCRMYNSGEGWQKHMTEVKQLCERITDLDLIVEIGAGDCSFLASLETDAIKLAVDPCDAVQQAEELGLFWKQEHFDVESHLPDDARGNTLVIMRHMLEHMENPRAFLEQIVCRAKQLKHKTFLYIETPCCQEALKKTRIEDWTYEHPQHFNVKSMSLLLRACGIDYSSVETGYDGEVLKAVAMIEPSPEVGMTVDDILASYKKAKQTIEDSIDWLAWQMSNRNVAFWGGAGKSAMFINMFGLDTSDTVVVDSHDTKWGYCVPGTGVKIQSPQILKDNPVDFIIATTSWRANDIAREIKRDEIKCKQLLKFENGYLMEVPLG